MCTVRKQSDDDKTRFSGRTHQGQIRQYRYRKSVVSNGKQNELLVLPWPPLQRITRQIFYALIFYYKISKRVGKCNVWNNINKRKQGYCVTELVITTTISLPSVSYTSLCITLCLDSCSDIFIGLISVVRNFVLQRSLTHTDVNQSIKIW